MILEETLDSSYIQGIFVNADELRKAKKHIRNTKLKLYVKYLKF